MSLKLPKIDKTMPVVVIKITDPKTGKVTEYEGTITPDMQRFWQSAVIKSDGLGNDLTGVVSKTGSVLYGNVTLTIPPTQGELQAMSTAIHNIALAIGP